MSRRAKMASIRAPNPWLLRSSRRQWGRHRFGVVRGSDHLEMESVKDAVAIKPLLNSVWTSNSQPTSRYEAARNVVSRGELGA